MKFSSRLLTQLCKRGIGPTDPRFAKEAQRINDDIERDDNRSQKLRWIQGAPATGRWENREALIQARKIQLRLVPQQTLTCFPCRHDPRSEVWVADENTRNEKCEMRRKRPTDDGTPVATD